MNLPTTKHVIEVDAETLKLLDYCVDATSFQPDVLFKLLGADVEDFARFVQSSCSLDDHDAQAALALARASSKVVTRGELLVAAMGELARPEVHIDVRHSREPGNLQEANAKLRLENVEALQAHRAMAQLRDRYQVIAPLRSDAKRISIECQDDDVGTIAMALAQAIKELKLTSAVKLCFGAGSILFTYQEYEGGFGRLTYGRRGNESGTLGE